MWHIQGTKSQRAERKFSSEYTSLKNEERQGCPSNF